MGRYAPHCLPQTLGYAAFLQRHGSSNPVLTNKKDTQLETDVEDILRYNFTELHI